MTRWCVELGEGGGITPVFPLVLLMGNPADPVILLSLATGILCIDLTGWSLGVVNKAVGFKNSPRSGNRLWCLP